MKTLISTSIAVAMFSLALTTLGNENDEMSCPSQLEALIGSNVMAAVLGALVVVIGWHYSSRQSVREERRRFETKHMVKCFRQLYSVSNTKMNDRTSESLTKVLGDLNIFGTSNQIELARNFAESMGEDGSANADKLLRSLRDELRQELAMDNLKEKDLLLARFGGTGDQKNPKEV